MMMLVPMRAALMRLLLALALAAGLGAPHRAAGGAMMVICGAAGSYTFPMDGGGQPAPAHDGACCLILCGGVLPAAAALPRPPSPVADATPARGLAPLSRRIAAHHARAPPAPV